MGHRGWGMLGCLRGLQMRDGDRDSRPNHFTLVEIWRDQAALEGHEVAAHARVFRDLLLPMSGSLYDQRLYRALEWVLTCLSPQRRRERPITWAWPRVWPCGAVGNSGVVFLPGRDSLLHCRHLFLPRTPLAHPEFTGGACIRARFHKPPQMEVGAAPPEVGGSVLGVPGKVGCP